jgi:hypothetical protein
VYPKVDSFIHQPGEYLRISLTVQNLSDYPLYFSRVEIAPSWIRGKEGIKILEQKDYIPSNSSLFLTEFNLTLPQKIGLYMLKFGLETWVYNYYKGDWENLGVLWTENWGYIQITPKPIYRAFISRSERPEDAPLIWQIVKMIKLWGFETMAHGINVFSEDLTKIPSDIKRNIDQADAVIAIATPRDYSEYDKSYKTFAWFHVETGMAFEKPLLFIVDERVKPEGLLEYPNFPKVFFHPTKLEVLEHRLAVIMPGFRRWIADKRREEFYDGLVKAGLILGGIWLVSKIFEE